MENNQVLDILLQIKTQVEGLHSTVSNIEIKVDTIETKIDDLESRMSGMESRMDNMESKMTNMESRIGSIESTVSNMESDIAGIKETVNRIEQQQQEDVIALLKVIDCNVTEINERQEETDHVIDVLSARTTRLQAKTEHLSNLDN
ncbi:hypothetical protein [Paenibacillus agilis]|uniref:Uncharacterized protein n=1 Tax=Paenibacillus agilis TaxID=3020863 RepID=A0A559IPS9_9BACL|nr:hypothetical protein [Paenibacillus agilis]TVX89652.1 hypothetical protein FPZ44_17970 [Paenibacillus agilis]